MCRQHEALEFEAKHFFQFQIRSYWIENNGHDCIAPHAFTLALFMSRTQRQMVVSDY